MEEDSRPASLDLAAADVCRNELTRTNSNSSSVTADVSKNFSTRRSSVARPEIPRRHYRQECTAWTNEKHNSYLASLEASFVKQLHHSLGLLSACSEQHTHDPSPSQQLPLNASCSSDQFKVLQDGFWQRIKFERTQPLPYNAAGSHFVNESSWRHHLRCSSKHSTKISADLRECSTSSEELLSGKKRIFTHRLSISGQPCVFHECDQDAVGNTAEVSDQNFVDVDQEEKSRSLSRSKRLKMNAADSSTNDQIVPSGDIFAAEIPNAGNK